MAALQRLLSGPGERRYLSLIISLIGGNLSDCLTFKKNSNAAEFATVGPGKALKSLVPHTLGMSSAEIALMPQAPSISPFQAARTPKPMGVISPKPVTTTLRGRPASNCPKASFISLQGKIWTCFSMPHEVMQAVFMLGIMQKPGPQLTLQ